MLEELVASELIRVIRKRPLLDISLKQVDGVYCEAQDCIRDLISFVEDALIDSPISQEAMPAVEPERNETTGPGKPKSCGPLAVVPLEYFVTVERIVS
jgi:hypothetical protein